jgi:hypothetical protein
MGVISIPRMTGVRFFTVENAWQFIKVWLGETKWRRDAAIGGKLVCLIGNGGDG